MQVPSVSDTRTAEMKHSASSPLRQLTRAPPRVLAVGGRYRGRLQRVMPLKGRRKFAVTGPPMAIKLL